MEEEDREVCKFLIVLAASCRMVRALRVGTRLRLRLRLRLEARGQEAPERGGGGRRRAFRGSEDAQYRRWYCV